MKKYIKGLLDGGDLDNALLTICSYCPEATQKLENIREARNEYLDYGGGYDAYIALYRETCDWVLRLKLPRFFLTSNGNILAIGDKRAFMRPDGYLLREATPSECEHLEGQGLIEVYGELPPIPELPKWEYLATICVCQDFSSYIAGLSCNGGAYSFHTYEDWFVGKVNGEWVFRSVTHHRTSAEFGYDELTGLFQNDCGHCHVVNVADPFFSYWTRDTQDVVLEQISDKRPFSELWCSLNEYIPNKTDLEDGDVVPALSFSQKKDVVANLKGLGVEKPKPVRRRKGRKGGERR